jgi:hypothetical protein
LALVDEGIHGTLTPVRCLLDSTRTSLLWVAIPISSSGREASGLGMVIKGLAHSLQGDAGCEELVHVD